MYMPLRRVSGNAGSTGFHRPSLKKPDLCRHFDDRQTPLDLLGERRFGGVRALSRLRI